MEVYFRINPSTYAMDDAKSVTLLNRMGKGQGKYFADTWLHILANANIKAADKDFNHVKQAFANMFVGITCRNRLLDKELETSVEYSVSH